MRVVAPRVSSAAVPLSFEPSPAAGGAFVARGERYLVAVGADGVAVDAGAGAPIVRMRLLGGASVLPRGERQVAVSHRLVGPPSTWQTHVPMYARVLQSDVWPGIGVVYYGAGRHLEWDFTVGPHADPRQIAFRIEQANVRLHDNGDLVIEAGDVELRQRRPVAYQLAADGARVSVPAYYDPRPGGEMGIEVGDYDRARPLIIDPVLVFGTYLGGTGGEFWTGSNVAGIALDPSGNIVVSGDTASPSFGGVTPTDLRAGGGSARDVFVARFTADGTTLLSLTYLGGNALDDRASVVVRADGSIFVAGRSNSTDLPVTPGARAHGGGADAFVYKLDATASAVTWMTYVGGQGDDWANAIALDTTGRPVVAGSTTSAAFPVTQGAPQQAYGGNADGFVAVLDANTGAVAFASYIGGSAADDALSTQVNDLGQIFVAGTTRSANFPVVNPIRDTLSGPVDAFLSAMVPGTPTLLASTYFGGAGGNTEAAHDLTISPGRAVHLVGLTDSQAFPVTAGAFQPTHGGLLDGFAARFAWNGSTLSTTYATYLGGAGNDAALSAGVTRTGALVVTGATQSPTFPPTAGAFDSTLGGSQDAYVLTLDPTGSAVTSASYYGGAGIDVGLALMLDSIGDAYIIGQTSSLDLPTTSIAGTPWDTTPNGAEDAFLFRVSTDLDRDGLPDDWERGWGLDPTTGAGDQGAGGDPDRDQLTNAEELELGTNPLLAERFFAEGALGTPSEFETRFAVLNPWDDITMDVDLELLTANGERYTHTLANVGPGERRTLLASDVFGAAGLTDAEFSTRLRSPYGVVADRTMTWDRTGYGSHAETSISRPGHTWYLAEGATHSNFDLFYLIQNTGSEPASVRVTYLRPAGKPPLQKVYPVAANSRQTIWVNHERFPDATGDALLADEEVSAVLDVLSGPRIIVERAMYQTNPGQPVFAAGHESAGAQQASPRWFLAEGATNEDYFSEFILIANPTTEAAQVTVTYLRENGEPIVKRYGGAGADYPVLPPQSRTTVWVNYEDARLANAAVSAVVEATNGVGLIVERAMWWPGNNTTWTEAHNSLGTTQSGTLWALAEGEAGGASSVETYILIANTSAFSGRARVTLHYEDGSRESAIVSLPASTRRTIAAAYQPEFTKATQQPFGVIVEALAQTDGGTDVPQIVVERAMYSADSARAFEHLFSPYRPYWPAGTNAVGTRLR